MQDVDQTRLDLYSTPIEEGPLPADLRGGTIVTVIRPPIDKLAQTLTVSLLFKRDGKMWLLKSHDVDMHRMFGPMTSHLVVETPLSSIE